MPIVFKLSLDADARRDLEGLWASDSDSAAVLAATLQHIAGDQRLLDSLTIKDFGSHGSDAFHVDRWVEQQREGRNLWRLKVWELEGKGKRYRVAYALDPRTSRYYVLGIFTRDFNYDATDARTRRILASYDRLGIPAYR